MSATVGINHKKILDKHEARKVYVTATGLEPTAT